jgi:pantoate--beta-alanine ligase
MEIINRRQRMFSISRKVRRESKTVAFVPTMGALHEGHLALVRAARQRCDVLVVSIFVNPRQFNDAEDLERYPRELTSDAALLTEFDVDYLFAPDVEEMYPPGFATKIDVGGLGEGFEGTARSGHFSGVATVITILFNTIRPDLAFFGQKDAQQVAVIKRLTHDLGFETEIVALPTVREESGLAMSSRNTHLEPSERQSATILIQALREAKAAYKKGERNASVLTRIVEDRIRTDPAIRLDYAAIVDRETIERLEKVGDEEALIVVAAYLGTVRLIDNVILNRKQ